MSKSYRLVRRNLSRGSRLSVGSNGLREFDSNARLFVVPENAEDVEPEEIERIAQRILSRYHNGVPFIDAEWKGDAALHLQSIFVAQKEFGSPRREYECLSNEMTLDSNGFRQVTKGREI